MGLLNTLQMDMTAALKAGDRVKLDALRFLVSQVKYVQIDQGELTDEQVQKLIAKEIKQSEEAILQFKQGNRTDLVDQENLKLEVWRSYLPQSISADEVDKVITQVLADMEKPEFGPVMKAVMAQIGTKASGQLVAERLKQALGAKS